MLPIMPGHVNSEKQSGGTYPLEGTMVLYPQKAPYSDPLRVLIYGDSTLPNGAALDNCISIGPEVPNDEWVIERMPSKRVLSCIAAIPDGTFMILNGANKVLLASAYRIPLTWMRFCMIRQNQWVKE
jgi:hypothetical protein